MWKLNWIYTNMRSVILKKQCSNIYVHKKKSIFEWIDCMQKKDKNKKWEKTLTYVCGVLHMNFQFMF